MSSNEAEEVRSRADIVRIVGESVKLRKAGANFVGLCPFHQEKTPSFSVHPVKQIFHCFGCGVGGDVFKFVMLMERVSFPEALERVAERVGVKLHASRATGADAAKSRERETLFKIHEAAAKFFAAQLGGTAEGRVARGYLADRGLGDRTIGRFRIGYAPGDGGALVRHLGESGFPKEAVVKSGLALEDARERRMYDRFRRRIVFPVANESGKVVAFGGRALGDSAEAGPKYLNSPETSIYTKGRTLYNLDRSGAAIRKQDCAVLVEGYMDAIAVDSAGAENVVASCGTSLTESQIRLLGRYTRRVIVNFDPDSAGMAATERSLGLFLEEGFEVKILALGDGQPGVKASLDPDAYIRAAGDAAYRERLSGAVSYLDYLTERAAARRDLRTPEGKVAAANDVLPYIARTPNPMLRAELANRLASRLGLDDRLMLEEVNRAARQGAGEVAMTARSAISNARPAEKLLLQTFLGNAELASEFLGPMIQAGACDGLASEKIFRRMEELHRAGEKLEISAIEESLNEDEKRLIYEGAFEPAPTMDRTEVAACIRALERKKFEGMREKLQNEIRAAEREGDEKLIAELIKKKSRLFNNLSRTKEA